jgi:hypothetical protein
MSSAWDNLMANAQQNNLLSDAGMFKPTQSYINWLEGLKYANPNVTPIQLGLDAVSRSGGDSDFRGAAAGVDHTDPKQDFRDYWNLDNDWAGTRDIAQGVNWLAGGGMLGNAAIMGADYAYGRNPAEDVGSLIGSQLATPYARSMEEAMALGKAGSSLGSLTANSLVGNNVFGEYLSPYTQGIKDSPWHDELTAMGLEQGTNSYDHALTAMMGGDLRSVDPDMMQAYDDRGQKNWRTSENTVEDYKAGSITAIEPTSVNDFVGMFSGAINDITGGISNYFNTPANTSSPLAPQTYAQQMRNAYGAESDPYSRGYEAFGQEGDATSRDASGTTWHSKDYNWGSTDGGASDTDDGGYGDDSDDGGEGWGSDDAY